MSEAKAKAPVRPSIEVAARATLEAKRMVPASPSSRYSGESDVEDEPKGTGEPLKQVYFSDLSVLL